MTLQNIVRPETQFIEEYRLEFDYVDSPGCGFSFPCDRNGKVDLTDGNTENYYYCINNPEGKMTEGILIDTSYSYTPDMYGTCDCGRRVYLRGDYGYGIDCDCGRIYNFSGQELAPRSQWDEYMNDGDTHMVSEMMGGYND